MIKTIETKKRKWELIADSILIILESKNPIEFTHLEHELHLEPYNFIFSRATYSKAISELIERNRIIKETEGRKSELRLIIEEAPLQVKNLKIKPELEKILKNQGSLSKDILIIKSKLNEETEKISKTLNKVWLSLEKINKYFDVKLPEIENDISEIKQLLVYIKKLRSGKDF